MKQMIKIGWLYPELMSTYGDRGNILSFSKRCTWRGIETQIIEIDQTTTKSELEQIDFLFGGGAQDREQEIVINDLRKKGDTVKKLIEAELPALFVCGAPQLMGKYYEPAEGKRIEGLGIFDMTTTHPGKAVKRLVGNVIAQINWENLNYVTPEKNNLIIGFENHGGRTHLSNVKAAFATVINGNGNNGTDTTEGVVYKNAIGSYFHGPLLPKNPHLTDYLIRCVLKRKYDDEIKLKPLDDTLEKYAQEAIAKRMGVTL